MPRGLMGASACSHYVREPKFAVSCAKVATCGHSWKPKQFREVMHACMQWFHDIASPPCIYYSPAVPSSWPPSHKTFVIGTVLTRNFSIVKPYRCNSKRPVNRHHPCCGVWHTLCSRIRIALPRRFCAGVRASHCSSLRAIRDHCCMAQGTLRLRNINHWPMDTTITSAPISLPMLQTLRLSPHINQTACNHTGGSRITEGKIMASRNLQIQE